MFSILKGLPNLFGQIFRKGELRIKAIILIVVASLIPLSQLFVIKVFSTMIMHKKAGLSVWHIIGQFALFFGLYGSTHLITYWQKTYRVKVFDGAFKVMDTKNKLKETWQWALAFELTNLFHMIITAVILIVYFSFVDWRFGILNFAVILASLEMIAWLYRKHLKDQHKFVDARNKKQHVENSIRVGSRIRSGEAGTLLSSAGLVVLLAALLLLSYTNVLDASGAVVLFLGLRMQNSNLSGISGGLMRLARAMAYSGQKYEDEDEDEDED